MCFVFTVVQGQARLRVSGCCCWSGCCLWCSYRGHALQPGGGLLFLEPGPDLESGASPYPTDTERDFEVLSLKVLTMECCSLFLLPQLFCSMSATFTLNFFRSGINFNMWGSFQLPGLLNFGEFKVKSPRTFRGCWVVSIVQFQFQSSV